MSAITKISWCDRTWNPVRGCSRVSTGCQACYAEKMAYRFSGVGKPFEGLVKKVGNEARWTGEIKLVEKALTEPFSWKKPAKVFVNSMSDLFHPGVPFEFIDQVFATMALADWHIYQILTKRPARMLEYFQHCEQRFQQDGLLHLDEGISIARSSWPLDNVWLGVSVENQEAADERIPLLLQVPAVVRFLSCEPLLGPVDLWGARYQNPNGGRTGAVTGWAGGVNWVICGGESGNNARPMHPNWVTGLRDQCVAAEVAFHFKQWGEWMPKPQIMEWSDDSVGGWAVKPEWKEKVAGKDWGALTFNGVYSDKTTTWNGRQLDPEDNSECTVYKVGKKVAGRELDSRVWDEFPTVGELEK
jgi:protein gp37